MIPHQQAALFQLSNDLADQLLEVITTAVKSAAHSLSPIIERPRNNGDGGAQFVLDASRKAAPEGSQDSLATDDTDEARNI